MNNIKEIIDKIDELSCLLHDIKEENLNKEILEISYKYKYELLKYKRFVSGINIDNLNESQLDVLKKAEDNINTLYNKRAYIYKLTLSKKEKQQI